ncbi:hypothetical protein D3C83_121210 [compost metagenome]
MDHGGARRILGHVHDPLYAQEIRAAIFRERRKEKRQGDGVQRPLANDAEGGDVVAMMRVRAAIGVERLVR